MLELSLLVPMAYAVVTLLTCAEVASVPSVAWWRRFIRPIERMLIFIVVVVLLFSVALRGEYGTDYDNYSNYFVGNIENGQLGLLFQFVYETLRVNRLPYTVVCSFFAVGALYIILLRGTAAQFGRLGAIVFCYLASLTLYPNMLGSIRQGLAMLLMGLAYMHLRSRRPIHAYAALAGAFLLHTGALAAIVGMAQRGNMRRRFLTIAAVVTFAALFVVVQQEEIFRKLTFYAATEGYTGGSASQILGKFFFAPFVFLLWRQSDSSYWIPVVILFAAASITPALFVQFPVLAERLGGYFELYKLIILHFLSVTPNALRRWPWVVFLLLLCASTLYKVYDHLSFWDSYFFKIG
jgi:EpsG family